MLFLSLGSRIVPPGFAFAFPYQDRLSLSCSCSPMSFFSFLHSFTLTHVLILHTQVTSSGPVYFSTLAPELSFLKGTSIMPLPAPGTFSGHQCLQGKVHPLFPEVVMTFLGGDFKQCVPSRFPCTFAAASTSPTLLTPATPLLLHCGKLL
jgi:hypothetical protein